MVRNIIKAALVLIIFQAVFFVSCSGKKTGTSYEFANIRRGTLERTVTSSGKINPVSTVRVLPQMSGKVEKIYVDYNDEVRKGDILAELNTDMLRLKREQQNASVVKARSNYELQQINYRSQMILAEKNLISEYELRTNKTQLDGLAADLAVAEANLKVIETEINQYAYITSPIDGIVLDRSINEGDSVVDSSSNNTYSIFTLAENLKEMQIEASVGELDVVSIHRGQAVRFSLESLPGRVFHGEVESLRMVPVVANNVVSYTVIVKVENQDGSLFPGMTCAVDFIVERSENVLMVSSAALRYQPTNLSEERIADMVFEAGLAGLEEEQRQEAILARVRAQTASPNSGQSSNQASNSSFANILTGQGTRMPRMMDSGRQAAGQGQNRAAAPAIVMRNLWYFAPDGKIAVVRVQTGITSGSFTEILDAEDLEGRQVVLRERI